MVEKVDYQGIDHIKISQQTTGTYLLVGASGSGKSIFTNSFAWQLKHFKKYKVIYLTEKPDSCMENAFCGIERKNHWQEQKLGKDWMLGDEVIKKEEIEIYHPFTFNFDVNKIPDCINLFTLPIKEIDDLSYSALLGRELDSPTTILCQEVKTELDNNDDIYSFLFKSFLKSSLNDTEEIKLSNNISRTNMGLPLDSYGSKRDVEQIKYAFRKIEYNYFLQDKDCPLNLSEEKLVEICNNNKLTTLFTMWKINDDKLQYFIYIDLLLKLRKIISKGLIKVPVLLVLEEIKILLPKTSNLKYVNVLAEILSKMLAGIRSSGVVILATTQSYYETNSDFRAGVDDNHIIMMRLSAEDQKSLSRDYPIPSENYQILNSLKVGEMVLFNNLKEKDSVTPKFSLFYVPFAHREKGYPHFWTYWKERYPERMKSIKEVMKEMKIKQETQWHLQELRVQEFLQKLEESKRKKEEKSEEKKEIEPKISAQKIEPYPETIKKRGRKAKEVVPNLNIDGNYAFESQINRYREELPKEKVVKEDLSEKCYELALNTPEGSWEARTFLIDGLSAQEMEKLAVKHARSVKNKDFITKFSSLEKEQEWFDDG